MMMVMVVPEKIHPSPTEEIDNAPFPSHVLYKFKTFLDDSPIPLWMVGYGSFLK